MPKVTEFVKPALQPELRTCGDAATASVVSAWSRSRATFSPRPPSPGGTGVSESQGGWHECPASGWGLAFVAPFRHGIYAGGVAADPSSQPALPISKKDLGRLDTLVQRLRTCLERWPLSALLNAHSDSPDGNLTPHHTVSPARKNAPISRTLVQRAAHVKVRRSRRCVTCADRKWRRTLREVSAQGPVQLPLTRLLRARLQVYRGVGILDHPRTSR